MTQKPKSDRRAIVERRAKPLSGRRETDNHEERERRVAQVLEYLRRQTRAADFEPMSVVRTNLRNPKR